MNTKEFYQTLGARCGLGLDAEKGIIGGTSNGFRVDAIANGSKLNLVMALIKNGNKPSDQEVKMCTSSVSSISEVKSVGKAIMITLSGASHNMKGITQTADAILAITKSLKDAGFEDDSENCAEDMEIKGKNMSTAGKNDYTDFLRGILGAFAGLFVAVMLMAVISTSFPMAAGMLSVGIFLTLPIIGFELFKGQRSILSLIITFVILIICSEILVRLQTATEVYMRLKTAGLVLSSLANMEGGGDLFSTLGEVLNPNLSVMDIFWMLPSIFKAGSQFRYNLYFGYAESGLLVGLTYLAYYKGHSGLIDYLLWIQASIYGHNR